MDYCIHGHRHADYLFSSLEEYSTTWFEVLSALDSINDQDIIDEFESEKREAKSISQAINRIVKNKCFFENGNAKAISLPIMNTAFKLKVLGDSILQKVPFQWKSPSTIEATLPGIL